MGESTVFKSAHQEINYVQCKKLKKLTVIDFSTSAKGKGCRGVIAYENERERSTSLDLSQEQTFVQQVDIHFSEK
jgi:hypothetical protein